MVTAFTTHGALSWFELQTKDVAAAKEFYSKLFGWTYDKPPVGSAEGMEYSVIKYAGVGMGGIGELPPVGEKVPPHWGIYITVENADETVKQAKLLGATILVPPTDIPKVGRFAVIQDPQGAILSVIKYTGEMP